MIIEFKGMRPDVEKATFIADSATLSGDIHLAENTSVWFGASVRAEVASITIGRDSNVQDNAMLHADYDLPITIGERVSVGHNAIVHGATIEDDVIVGMHATVMNGAHVGRGSIIAAGIITFLPEILRDADQYRLLIYAVALILMMLLNASPKFMAFKEAINPKRLWAKRMKKAGKEGA